MRLRDADRQPAESTRLVRVQLLGRGRVVLDATGAVDPKRNRLDLLAQRRGIGIEELEGR